MRQWRNNVSFVPPSGFVDLHSHVLPFLDDGPETWGGAMETLANASIAGTTLMAATPHGGFRKRWDRIEDITRACAELNERCVKEGIPLLLVPGMELPLELDVVDALTIGRALPLNGSPYVLIEAPFTQLPLFFESVLARLQAGGYRAILAHPERQAQMQTNPRFVERVRERGILIQVTAGSFLGAFGRGAKKSAEALLQQGLIDIIASDAHAPLGLRSPNLVNAFHAVAKLAGEADATRYLSETPRAIIEGESNVWPL